MYMKNKEILQVFMHLIGDKEDVRIINKIQAIK